MGLAEKQDIPHKKSEEKSDWSFRRLFPLKATVSAFTKHFTTPLDIILIFLVIVIAACELLGHHPSVMLYLLTICVLIADWIERNKDLLSEEDEDVV